MRAALAALAALPAATGCYTYPSSSDTYKDQIVVTAYDTSTDFGAFGTFAVSSQVDYIDTIDTDGTPQDLPTDLAGVLVDEVVTQLTSRGYEQVEPEDGPDLGAKITVVKGTVEGIDYATYWGGYGYYAPYYWGYYYPYAVPIYYEYNTTVAKVDLVDVRTARRADLEEAEQGALPPDLRALWSGRGYGVLEATSPEEAQQAALGIEQAFEQSPYIGRP